MGSTAKFSYRRLRNEGGFDDDGEDDKIRERVIGSVRSWPRIKRVHIRRRIKVRIPSLKRFLRRKTRPVMVSWAKVLKRLKESQSHFGDLFAGNYLFLQVSPTPLKSFVNKSLKGHNLDGLSSSSRFSVPRIADH